MKFNKVQFVYIDMDYLKKLNEVETEIFYDENNAITKKNRIWEYYFVRCVYQIL